MKDSIVRSIGQLSDAGVLKFSDGYRTRKDQLGSGIPILRVAEIKDGRVTVSRGDCVREEFRGRIGSKVSEQMDVLISTKGSVGRVALVPPGFPQHVYSPQLCFLRVVNYSTLDPRWLYYWASSSAFSAQAQAVQGQTDMAPYISLRDLSRFRIQVPPLEEQRRIAGVLGALDDLIAVDEELIKLVRELAWARVLEAQSDGASDVALADVCVFENRKRVPLSAAQRREIPGTYPYYGAAGQMDSVGEYLFDQPRVLVGEDGTVTTGSGNPVVQYVWGQYWVNNHAHVLAGKSISTELLRVLVGHADIRDRVTGAVQPKLNMGNLKSLRLRIPDDAGVDEFVRLLTHAEREFRDEVVQCRSARDDLLPLLISGRVRVGDTLSGRLPWGAVEAKGQGVN